MTTIIIHTAPTSAIATANERIVTARFKNPARSATIVIPTTVWDDLSNVPEQYRPILDAVLEKAVKDIISKHLNAYSLWPATLDAGYFAPAAIMDEATNANNTWLSKEELENAWRDSATRKQWVTRADYATSAPFRKAVARYEELTLKLSGKTSQYTPDDLDLLIAKLSPADHSTEFGAFVLRRVDALQNRPVKTNEVNTALL